MYEKTKKAYEEISSILDKHKDITNIEDLTARLKGKYRGHLFELELKEKYGFNIRPNTTDIIENIYEDLYKKFNDNIWIGIIGEKYRRTISWEDDGKAPKNELLLVLGFSSGAYVFGEDYLVELFGEFWKELKSYKPKYVDTQNHNMYFSMENAGKIFNEFRNIFDKYRNKYNEFYKIKKVKDLKEEIKRLETREEEK